MSERLHQLQRQQALIREHLAWIDAEIVAETAKENQSATSPESRNSSAASADTFADAEGSANAQPQPQSLLSEPRTRQLPPALTFAYPLVADPATSTKPTTPVALPLASAAYAGAASLRQPAASLPADAQALLDQYATDESNKREDARRGCFIIFAIALTVLILSVAAVWWFGYRKPA